jgi:hypothetical protein
MRIGMSHQKSESERLEGQKGIISLPPRAIQAIPFLLIQVLMDLNGWRNNLNTRTTNVYQMYQKQDAERRSGQHVLQGFASNIA